MVQKKKTPKKTISKKTSPKKSLIKKNSSSKTSSGKSLPRKNFNRKSSSKKTFSKKTTGKKISIFLLKIAGVFFLLLCLFFLVVYFGFLGDVPTSGQLEKIKKAQASEVFSADGKLLGKYYIENRSNVRFNEISPNVIKALVATEDSRFYKHRGIDEMALLRVFVRTIIFRESGSGGGSTLSQQIAKNLYPRNDLGFFSMPVNKLRESIIAYRLERIYTKEEILTLYLNTVSFGESTFGIDVASERFFHKKPFELTVDDAAILVGMLKANRSYNPRLHPQSSLERRNVVIGQMVKYNYLTEKEGKFYQSQPLSINYYKLSYNQGPAPYFVEMLRLKLNNWCKEHKKKNGESYNLYTDGLKIQTTLNSSMQAYARKSVSINMKSLQCVFDRHWSGRDPWEKDSSILKRAVLRSERYRMMKANGKSKDEIQNAFNQKRKMEIFTWNDDQKVYITPMDSLKRYLRLLNAGFLAMDPKNGAIRAWVGGIDFRSFKYDHVLSPRQVGSTFKPVVYLSALQQGMSPFEYYSNDRKVYTKYKNWSPRNSHNDYTGYYSMQGALAKSLNTIAVDLMVQSGIENTIRIAHDLGVNQELPAFPSLALGTASISLEEMVATYSSILSGGIYHEPYYLISIKDNKGNLIGNFGKKQPEKTSADKKNCQMVIHMLESVIDEGTGKSIRRLYTIPGSFAGKTGTTQNQSDGWFIGMNPDLVTGCWVGAEDPGIHFRTITYGQGAYMALPVVGSFFDKLYKDSAFSRMQYSNFAEPSYITRMKLDRTPYKETIGRNFLKGSEKNISNVDKENQGVRSVKEKSSIWNRIRSIFKKKK